MSMIKNIKYNKTMFAHWGSSVENFGIKEPCEKGDTV
jgi:hypothetical protein